MKLVALTAVFWLMEMRLALAQVADLPDGFVTCNQDELVSNTMQPFISSSHNPFCMNGGTCKKNYQDTPENPCDCPTGVAGPHCEFEDGIVPDDDDCDLECFNDGVCQAGVRTWTGQHFAISPDRWNYCQCKEGFYGPQCEFDGRQCGPQTHCLNGGSCVKIQHKDGDTHHCDCTTSRDEKGAQFAGRYCQIKAESTCSDHDPVNPTNYCVNGGKCRPEAWLGCECPTGFMGHMCEFNQIDDEPYECNMQCDNGFCRKGAKDTSWLTDFNFGNRRLTQRFTQDFEHCQCPPGWVGLYCEAKMNVCPGRSNVCLNGGGCVLSDSDPSNPFNYECDCSKADENDGRYAGKYCQYRATSFCTVDGRKSKNDAFCTNDGVCRDYVKHGEPHPGCVCDDAFEGDHCEVLVGSDPDSDARDGDDIETNQGDGNDNISSGLIWIFVVVITFVSMLMMVFAAVMYRRSRMQERFIMNAAHSHLKSLDQYHDDDTENFAAGENGSNPETELSLDPIYEAKYSDTPPKVDPSGDGRSVDGDASRISKISTSDKTRKAKGGKSRKPKKGSGKKRPGPPPLIYEDGEESPDASESRYEDFMGQKGPSREFDDAALMSFAGESRTISHGNDDNFNPADFALRDYSFEEASIEKMPKLSPNAISNKDREKQGRTKENSSDIEMEIKRKRTDNSGSQSGMSSEIASMSSMGSSQNFARNLQSAGSYDSLAQGPTIYLSDDYSLGQGSGRRYEVKSPMQDIPSTIGSDSQIETSNMSVLSQTAVLAGTVLSNDNSSISNSSINTSDETQSVREVSVGGKSPSENASTKSVTSVSTNGVRSVQFEQTSMNFGSFSSALTEVAAGGRTLDSDSSASSVSSLFGGNKPEMEAGPISPDLRKSQDMSSSEMSQNASSQGPAMSESGLSKDPQEASVSTSKSSRSQKSEHGTNKSLGREGSAFSAPATTSINQTPEERDSSTSIETPTPDPQGWVVRITPSNSRVARMQAGWQNDDSSEIKSSNQDEQSTSVRSTSPRSVRSSARSVHSKKSVQSNKSIESSRKTQSNHSVSASVKSGQGSVRSKKSTTQSLPDWEKDTETETQSKQSSRGSIEKDQGSVQSKKSTTESVPDWVQSGETESVNNSASITNRFDEEPDASEDVGMEEHNASKEENNVVVEEDDADQEENNNPFDRDNGEEEAENNINPFA